MRPISAAVLLVAALSPLRAEPAPSFDGAGSAAPLGVLIRSQAAPAAPPASAAATSGAAETVFAFPVGSDRVGASDADLAQRNLSYTLTTRLSPWDDRDLIVDVQVCDPTPHDPMENFEPCGIYQFSFGRQLKTDLAAHAVRRGGRVLAKIADTDAGPALDWGAGGPQAAVAWRVSDGRLAVFLKP
jgi:hypothetical protein